MKEHSKEKDVKETRKILMNKIVCLIRGQQTVLGPESPVPLHVRQPRRIPETFGERVAVDLQLGYLGKTHTSRKQVRHVSLVSLLCSKTFFFHSFVKDQINSSLIKVN